MADQVATATDDGTGRRLPLTRDRVLRAAVALADREGIDAVSMRRLGQELSVEAMSLYNHVANKEEILNGMVDVIVGEIEPAAVDAGWRDALRQRVLSARRALLRHPWASAVMASRKTVTPPMMEYMDSVAGVLRNGGFSVDLVHHTFHVMGSRILGFAQELYDDSEQLAESPEIAEVMLRGMSEKYPHLAEMALSATHDATIVGTGCDDQFEFEFGLDLILDGLERLRSNTSAA